MSMSSFSVVKHNIVTGCPDNRFPDYAVQDLNIFEDYFNRKCLDTLLERPGDLLLDADVDNDAKWFLCPKVRPTTFFAVLHSSSTGLALRFERSVRNVCLTDVSTGQLGTIFRNVFPQGIVCRDNGDYYPIYKIVTPGNNILYMSLSDFERPFLSRCDAEAFDQMIGMTTLLKQKKSNCLFSNERLVAHENDDPQQQDTTTGVYRTVTLEKWIDAQPKSASMGECRPDEVSSVMSKIVFKHHFFEVEHV